MHRARQVNTRLTKQRLENKVTSRVHSVQGQEPNNKEAPMHDAFMPIGIRTTPDHNSDQGSLHASCSSQVSQTTPHSVGLIPSVIYRALHLSVVQDRTYRQHHESQCQCSSRFQPDFLAIRTCSVELLVITRFTWAPQQTDSSTPYSTTYHCVSHL